MTRPPLRELSKKSHLERPDRRELIVMAACGGLASLGMEAAHAGAFDAGDAKFPEPATAADYMTTMRLGTQAGDYLEMPYEPAGLRNQLTAREFDVMRREGRFDHVRIPANCAIHADGDGVIEERFLQKLDAQVALALERFERVLIDPLHHYHQWFGGHGTDKLQMDVERVAPLTAEQHGERATAMWVQLAKRYKDVSLRLSFDLVNEPGGSKPQPPYPPGMTWENLNDWYAAVIPAIRATGGRNARRMVWLEPWNARLDVLAIPANAGPLGVSPHNYLPFSFTHQAGGLTPAGLSNYAEFNRYVKRWGEKNRVPIWIGEAGVSRRVSVGGPEPRSPAERAEYTAHIRNVALESGIPVCYWDFNNNFALYDQAGRAWMPDMQQAVSGLPTPLPVRAYPPFVQLKGGRIARGPGASQYWNGFSYDAETGLLSAQDNRNGPDRPIVVVFPDIPVASNQIWTSRASEFSGNWQVGTCPFAVDPGRTDRQGQPVDVRTRGLLGNALYPGWRPGAPGGFDNPYGVIADEKPVFAIDAIFTAGSPAGSIRFSCLRAA